MRNEKKYELTLSDLQVYIGIASFEALPKDATPEVVDMYNTVAARIMTKSLNIWMVQIHSQRTS